MNRASNLLRSRLVGQVSSRTKAYLGELKGTMNDLPQPGGSWQTSNEAQQRKYTTHLIVGLGFFTFTIVFGKASGLFFFNATIPNHPVEKNDYSK